MATRNRNTSAAPAPQLSTTANSMPCLKIGPAGWAYKDWAGYVYPQPRPKDFHPATFLAEYFDTIEINTSFYHPMKPEHAAQWIDRVAANPRFVFTAKLWKKFTHEQDATVADEREARAGLDILLTGNKLGALLLQFPFSFHREPETIVYLQIRSEALRHVSAGCGGAALFMEYSRDV